MSRQRPRTSGAVQSVQPRVPTLRAALSTGATALVGPLLALLLAGCPDSDSASDQGEDAGAPASDAAANSGELPSDVDAVLEHRCRECHQDPPRNMAPFPLVTYENTQVRPPGYPAGTKIYDIMQLRIHDPEFPMPPDGRELTDADRKVLDDWFESGAKPAE